MSKDGHVLGYGARLRLAGFLCAACLAAGCATLNWSYGTKPQDGFHAATPFHMPPASAGTADRLNLYQAYRVSVNPFGFQVGLVPMDADQLAQYFVDGGRPDLATQLQESEGDLRSLNARIVHLERGFIFNPRRLRSAKAELNEKSAEILDLAHTYNVSLLAQLQLGDNEAMASPLRGLPAPLDRSVVQIGTNAETDDWLWDRSIFRWHSDLSFSPLYWVGGRSVDPSQVASYMRSEDQSGLASEFAVGNSLNYSSRIVESSGMLIFDIGVVGAAAELSGTNDRDFQSFVAIAGGGIAIFVLGNVLDTIGFHKTKTAVLTFNSLLREKLGMRLEALPTDPAP